MLQNTTLQEHRNVAIVIFQKRWFHRHYKCNKPQLRQLKRPCNITEIFYAIKNDQLIIMIIKDFLKKVIKRQY